MADDDGGGGGGVAFAPFRRPERGTSGDRRTMGGPIDGLVSESSGRRDGPNCRLKKKGEKKKTQPDPTESPR